MMLPKIEAARSSRPSNLAPAASAEQTLQTCKEAQQIGELLGDGIKMSALTLFLDTRKSIFDLPLILPTAPSTALLTQHKQT